MEPRYLFCNLTYGRDFMAVFARFAERDAGVPHTVVLSTAPLRALPWHLRWRRARRARLAARALAGTCAVVDAQDVNLPSFIRSIPAGSLGVVAGFNQIFGEALIARFGRLANFHPSILPHYRGAIPSYWVLRNGEARSGFTLHEVTARIDAGPVLHQQYVDIPEGIDEGGLDALVASAGAGYLDRFLDAARIGQSLPVQSLPSPYHVHAGYLPATRPDDVDAVRNR